MNQSKKSHVFPIERKLAAIEWDLKLLKTSVTTTHTPVRTFRSMLRANLVLPATGFLERVAGTRAQNAQSTIV